ncbi:MULTISPECIES: hypothetical protein [unclassified Bradyrhizobium]|uniref:hypothetical protein n=1 Tax=unclassified Bradyrhizobium TaxID=2631580 RepID=UPI0028E638B6|nr:MULTISPECIES: hypothetical protein [unclassified Bradyrhizobium]
MMIRVVIRIRAIAATVTAWLSRCNAIRTLRGAIERKRERHQALINLDIPGLLGGLALGGAAVAVALYVIPQIEGSIAIFNYVLGGM